VAFGQNDQNAHALRLEFFGNNVQESRACFKNSPLHMIGQSFIVTKDTPAPPKVGYYMGAPCLNLYTITQKKEGQVEAYSLALFSA